jgi:hypothetical protein
MEALLPLPPKLLALTFTLPPSFIRRAKPNFLVFCCDLISLAELVEQRLRREEYFSCLHLATRSKS